MSADKVTVAAILMLLGTLLLHAIVVVFFTF